MPRPASQLGGIFAISSCHDVAFKRHFPPRSPVNFNPKFRFRRADGKQGKKAARLKKRHSEENDASREHPNQPAPPSPCTYRPLCFVASLDSSFLELGGE